MKCQLIYKDPNMILILPLKLFVILLALPYFKIVKAKFHPVSRQPDCPVIENHKTCQTFLLSHLEQGSDSRTRMLILALTEGIHWMLDRSLSTPMITLETTRIM
ncbi:transmembrane protein, putative [Medicago truncatula]|uniref:Transmembrane protein, putative n=1 Tax=Medicago truncatula TaxID=3880 RepID=A0A072TIT3_MEDTR|nr:transmembrane protein, putative [Medicago truncatula]